MAKHQKSKFAIHLVLTLITGGLWLIPLGIWYIVKKG